MLIFKTQIDAGAFSLNDINSLVFWTLPSWSLFYNCKSWAIGLSHSAVNLIVKSG